MAPNDDIKSYTTSTTDFYELLSLSPSFTQKELERAKRLTSFKYHPDKAGTGDHAREQLHLTSVGFEILNDPSLRAIYDNARSARERKKAAEAQLEGGRRKLKEELEAREAAGRQGGVEGLGVVRGGKLDDQAMRLRGLAEDGRRRREELQARREKEVEMELKREKAIEERASMKMGKAMSGRNLQGLGMGPVSNPFESGPDGSPSLEEQTLRRLREAALRQNGTAV